MGNHLLRPITLAKTAAWQMLELLCLSCATDVMCLRMRSLDSVKLTPCVNVDGFAEHCC